MQSILLKEKSAMLPMRARSCLLGYWRSHYQVGFIHVVVCTLSRRPDGLFAGGFAERVIALPIKLKARMGISSILDQSGRLGLITQDQFCLVE